MSATLLALILMSGNNLLIFLRIGAASWQVELTELDEVITDIMVASAESEKGAGRVMLYYLEMKARHCREMILMRVGKEN